MTMRTTNITISRRVGFALATAVMMMSTGCGADNAAAGASPSDDPPSDEAQDNDGDDDPGDTPTIPPIPKSTDCYNARPFTYC
jgi:hypothetical protein